MVSYNDKEYKATKLIKQGKMQMSSHFAPLVDWIDIEYGVKPLNIIYDFISDSRTLKNRRPRLWIIFEFENDAKQFNDASYSFDRSKQLRIAKKFAQTLNDQQLNTDVPFYRFWRISKITYEIENIWVVFTAFDKIAKHEANSHVSAAMIKKYKDDLNNQNVWTVMAGFSSVYVFLFTNAQVDDIIKTGLKEIWSARHLDLLKPYDEFSYFKEDEHSIILDSKENFDNNYQSNWFYYFK